MLVRSVVAMLPSSADVAAPPSPPLSFPTLLGGHETLRKEEGKIFSHKLAAGHTRYRAEQPFGSSHVPAAQR